MADYTHGLHRASSMSSFPTESTVLIFGSDNPGNVCMCQCSPDTEEEMLVKESGPVP